MHLRRKTITSLLVVIREERAKLHSLRGATRVHVLLKTISGFFFNPKYGFLTPLSNNKVCFLSFLKNAGQKEMKYFRKSHDI